MTNPAALLESSGEPDPNPKDDPKEVGASIFDVGDDSLSPLLADDDEPLVSPLPPGSAGLGSVEAVKNENFKHIGLTTEYSIELKNGIINKIEMRG